MSEQVLAFDFGLKHIGVAVGQSITASASPLTTISAHHGTPDWQSVEELVEQWRPRLLLVGLPLNMDGSKSEMSELARSFAARLSALTGLTVELVDERLSSFEAKQIEREQISSKTKPLDNHAIAAKLIAETWLQEN